MVGKRMALALKISIFGGFMTGIGFGAVPSILDHAKTEGIEIRHPDFIGPKLDSIVQYTSLNQSILIPFPRHIDGPIYTAHVTTSNGVEIECYAYQKESPRLTDTFKLHFKETILGDRTYHACEMQSPESTLALMQY